MDRLTTDDLLAVLTKIPLSDCRTIVRFCNTSKSIREWCDANVAFLAGHLRRDRAFGARFFEGATTIAQYREGCIWSMAALALHRQLERLMVVVDRWREVRRVQRAIVALEFPAARVTQLPSWASDVDVVAWNRLTHPRTQTGAIIELDTIHTVPAMLFLESTPHQTTLRLSRSLQRVLRCRSHLSTDHTRRRNLLHTARCFAILELFCQGDLTALLQTIRYSTLSRTLRGTVQDSANVAVRFRIDTHQTTVVNEVDTDDMDDLE